MKNLKIGAVLVLLCSASLAAMINQDLEKSDIELKEKADFYRTPKKQEKFTFKNDADCDIFVGDKEAVCMLPKSTNYSISGCLPLSIFIALNSFPQCQYKGLANQKTLTIQFIVPLHRYEITKAGSYLIDIQDQKFRLWRSRGWSRWESIAEIESREEL